MSYLTEENLAELNKFFVVAREYYHATGQRANMPACVVDSCWHELIEDDVAYASFTQRAVGRPVRHLENKGHGVIAWVPVYERLYGKLANPWFVSPAGQTATETKAAYAQSGELRMSWDCTPLEVERKHYEQTGELRMSWDCTPDDGDDADEIRQDKARPCPNQQGNQHNSLI